MKLILFGATGDLVKTKIMSALRVLHIEPVLYGRRDADLPNYIKGELDDIHERLQQLDVTHAYVSLPPLYYEKVLKELVRLKYAPRIALEKPFGTSYADALKLTHLIKELKLEDKIYLVDHYLGKPALVSMLGMSTGERQDQFDHHKIAGVYIDAFETNDVATRGAFYDSVGTIRDFVQNHILAIISTLLMQQGCESLSTKCRQNVLEHISYKDNSLILGQYEGFKNTEGVSPDSHTETYVSLAFNYKDTLDVRVRVGKGLNKAKTEAKVVYKDGTEKIIIIQSNVNSYEPILKDFISDESHFALSYEEAQLCWKIAEAVLTAKEGLVPTTYPQGADPDTII